MSGIETVENEASFFSRRKNAYHSLGTIVPDDITSTEDVLKHAKLDNWNISLESVVDHLPDDVSTHDIKDRYVFRDNPYYNASRKDEKGYNQSPRNLLGIVGGRFHDFPNEDLALFGEVLLAGGRWETAGSLKNGRQVFLSMALDSTITIDEGGVNESITSYLVLANSHDGSGSLSAFVSGFRPECTNSLNWGLKNAENKVNIRHTKSLEARVKAAKNTLNLATNYTTKFQEFAQDMFEASVDDVAFYDIVKRAYPQPDEDNKQGTTLWVKKVDSLMNIWESETIEGIKGTAWGALNALEEDQQWNRAVYAGNEENFWMSGAGFNQESNKQQNAFRELVEEYVAS